MQKTITDKEAWAEAVKRDGDYFRQNFRSDPPELTAAIAQDNFTKGACKGNKP